MMSVGLAVRRVEQQQEHVGRVLRVDREVDAVRRERRAQRIVRALGDGLRSCGALSSFAISRWQAVKRATDARIDGFLFARRRSMPVTDDGE